MNWKKIKADIERNRKKIEKLGPGIITGGAGDDPAGIATYTLVGATSGFSQLWLLLFSTPMMIAIQNMAARIALVTGKSLPEITNGFYSKKLTILMISVLCIANILTIAADLNALAALLHILTAQSTLFWLVVVTTLISSLVVFGSYKVVKRVLVGLTLFLGLYILSAILTKPPIEKLLMDTFIPTIQWQSAWIAAALGLLGTTISPYLLFWQASEEKEEKATVVQADEVDWDTIMGMIWSNLLAYCMIVTGAMLLHGTDVRDITQLALALKPVGGQYTFLLFSLGIIVSGLLAIPVLAGSTAYAVADTFGWREGMDNKVSDAKGFYVVFTGSLIGGAVIDVLPTLSVVDALYYSQVLDGMLIPLLIAILMMISNNRSIMGSFTPSKFENLFGLLAFLVTALLTSMMIWHWIQ